MTEYQSNGYDDADFRQQLDAIEELEAEQRSIRAKAASECGKIAKRIKNEKATAKSLGIPLSILNASLKTRKLERQIQAIADDIDEEMIEVWEDAAGQFSMFAPADGEAEEEVPVAAKAARRAKTSAEANAEAEQDEGAKVLDGLAGQTEAVH